MQNIIIKMTALGGLLALSACGPTEPPDNLATTADATKAFEDICLAMLPDMSMEAFDALNEQAGYADMGSRGTIRSAFSAPDIELVTFLVQGQGFTICAVGTETSGDGATLGNALLESAIAVAGPVQQSLPPRDYEYAEQLEDGHLIAHRAESLRYGSRNIVLLSNPISASMAPTLLSLF